MGLATTTASRFYPPDAEVVANYYRNEIGIADGDFERWLGPGWVYPVPFAGNGLEDGAWSNQSYMAPATPAYLQEGLWSDGPESTIYLPLQQGGHSELTFIGKAATGLAQGLSVQVLVDGQDVGTVQIPPGSDRRPFSIPVNASSGGLMTEVRLRFSQTVTSAPMEPSKKPKQIALNIQGLKLKKL